MALISFVTAWANAPFAIAAGLASAFALLQVTGVLGLLAGGDDSPDADVDHDVDHEVEHDASANHESDAGADRGWGDALVAPLGAGRIPFSMIWQTYALAFATTGYVMNLAYLGSPQLPPLVSLAWTVPASMAGGYATVAALARVLSPVLSSKGQEATSRAHLVGRIGIVISSRVDQDFGEVRIRDKSGHDVRVVCRLPPGTTIPVTESESVVVVDYDAARGDWLVEPLGDDFRAEGGKST